MFTNEIKLIEYIQRMRTPLWDEFFRFLNFFDIEIFYFILIPLIWIGYNWRFGVKLFFIFLLSAIVNDLLKNIFMLPRPFVIDPSLGLIKLKGYSFPSGAAQTALFLPLILINHFKKHKWPIIVGICYFVLISFSRMYLGVHFLSDVIAGWIVGFILFLIYLLVFPKIEKKIIKMGSVFSFWVTQGAALILLIIPSLSRFAVAFLSVILGLYLSKHFNKFLPNCKKFGEFFIRSIIAIVGIFIIYFAFYIIQPNLSLWVVCIMSYFQGLWISFFASSLYISLFSKKRVR